MKKNISVTRTFRLEKEWIEALEAEARAQGLSASSLLNQLMKRYALSLRFLDKSNYIHLSKDKILLMLRNCPDDYITQMGLTSGAAEKSNYLYMIGLTPTPENVVSYISLHLGKYAGWFNCYYSPFGIEHNLLLNHSFNIKWSLFLSSFMKAFIKSIIDADVESEIMESNVKINFRA